MNVASVSNAANPNLVLSIHIPNLIYICSLSMQLSAGLLLVGNVKVTWRGILEEYCARHRGIVFEESNLKLADYTDIKYVAQTSWTNAMAFLYLTLGYLMSVFGEAPTDSWNSFLWIIVTSVILCFVTYKWSVHKAMGIGEISTKDISMTGGVRIEFIGNKIDDAKKRIEESPREKMNVNEADIFSKHVFRGVGEIYINAKRKSRGANLYFCLQHEFLEATGGDIDKLKAYRMMCESEEKTTIDSGYLAIIVAVLAVVVSMLPEDLKISLIKAVVEHAIFMILLIGTLMILQSIRETMYRKMRYVLDELIAETRDTHLHVGRKGDGLV